MEAEVSTTAQHHSDLLQQEQLKSEMIQQRLDNSRIDTAKEKDGQKGLKKQLQEMAATILKLVGTYQNTNNNNFKKQQLCKKHVISCFVIYQK